MAIKSYVEDNQNYYEVYVHGHDANGSRQQWRRRGITSLRKAETIEFELKRKLAMLKERAVDLRFGEWIEECLGILKLGFRPSTLYTYDRTVQKWMMAQWRDLYLREITKQKARRARIRRTPARQPMAEIWISLAGVPWSSRLKMPLLP